MWSMLCAVRSRCEGQEVVCGACCAVLCLFKCLAGWYLGVVI
eukprot:COSAG01_NODE_42103_length_443_cov_2.406977_1_plen_41_part_10